MDENQLVLRVTTSPNDANPKGDIFGGWLMSKMDIAGSILATKRAQGHVSTVAVSELRFLKPIFVQDLVSFYAEIIKEGTTSLTVKIIAHAESLTPEGFITRQVGEAIFIYVAISKPGVKRALPEK